MRVNGLMQRRPTPQTAQNTGAMALIALVFLCLGPVLEAAVAAEPAPIRSVQSGRWSDGATWANGRVPGEGDRVQVATGHRVLYDVNSDVPIRAIHVAGVLSFATDRDTRLDVGLIRIEAGEDWKGEQFDLDAMHHAHHEPGADDLTPALEVGTPARPVGREHRALIRLVHFDGMKADDLPAIVCAGGRMDLHGAPLRRTWVKLAQSSTVGDNRLYLADSVQDWRPGDRLVVTATRRQRPFTGGATPHVTEKPASEQRTLDRIAGYGPMVRARRDEDVSIYVDEPLAHPHRAEDGFAGEVANLSRNVVIESADPEGARGHTMYHRHSSGSISYVELRHLGKRGVLGRYPIHHHLTGETMRGSSVVGASVWDSDNRWITLHQTQYMVVRDCVGYQSRGHGFYLENGTEVFNVFDRNLAIQAMVDEPLPDQAMPFDRNDGAGFWWANSLNAFTRNVAVECDQHGFRFEAVKDETFDPVLAVPQPDGGTEAIDIRTLPFVRFDDNEVHAQRRFGLNLGGIRGATFSNGRPIDQPQSVGGHVDGVGPPADDPFVIRDFKAWDTHWSFHAGSPSVLVKGMDIFDVQYGIWRSVMTLHEYNELRMRRVRSSGVYYPMAAGADDPEIGLEDGAPSFPILQPTDKWPPFSVITHVDELSDGRVEVKGVAIDNRRVVAVEVNGHMAEPVHGDYAQWRVVLPGDALEDGVLQAEARDEAGHREPQPHVRFVSHTAGHTEGPRP